VGTVAVAAAVVAVEDDSGAHDVSVDCS